MKRYLSIVLLFIFSFSPSLVSARVGVGVGTGKIVVDEILNPGTIYKLPPLTVFNTGDEPSTYEATVTYHEQQSELKPDSSWLTFDPPSFDLLPGDAQRVEITLSLPVKTVPGKYFAYLEGHPLKTVESGVTSVGVAAAAKFYFQVAPANFFEGLYYRIISFFKTYAPWTYVAVGLIAFANLVLIIRRFVKIDISVKTKNKKNE